MTELRPRPLPRRLAICPVCSTPLGDDLAPSAVYCSHACRQRAYRARVAERTDGHRTALAQALQAVEDGAEAADLHALLSRALRPA